MSKWTVDGTTIKKDGQAFFLAGVCYAPTPAGAATFTPGVGDWFTPPWNGIWERDFALMQQMGINNLRTYFFWAWTPPADMSTWKAVVSGPPTFDHSAFLDAAQAAGIYVTIGIALDGSQIFGNADPQSAQNYLSFYTATAEKLAELYGAHEAVMGFCLGNEQNTPSRIQQASFWDAFETISSLVKAKAPDKLVTLAMQDDPTMFTATIAGTQTSVPQRFKQIFDVWSVNIYSGMAGQLDSYRQNVVSNADTQLPLIVSEWGVAAGKNVPDGAAGPPDGSATSRELTPAEFDAAINGPSLDSMISKMQAMQNHRDFVMGAQYFEWTDEWWKNGATPVYEQNASSSPDWPEEWWGLYGIAPTGRTAQQGPWNQGANAPYPPDTLTARPTVAALIKMYQELAAA